MIMTTTIMIMNMKIKIQEVALIKLLAKLKKQLQRTTRKKVQTD